MRKRYIAAGVAVLVVLGGIALPPKDIALNQDCYPSGLATLQSNLFGEWFWRRQLAAIDQQRSRLVSEELARQDLQRKTAEIVVQADRILEDLYRKHPEMRPSEAAQAAKALRDRADAIEEAEWKSKIQALTFERVNWLSECEREIRKRF